ncbi:MAG: PD40 domain-containing protein, partial [Anaerolineae bacterium]|nr:PD40 domain-containing protein [Anaerolineae bacterium]
MLRVLRGLGMLVIGLLLAGGTAAQTGANLVEVCPGTPIQPRSATFTPGGIILTAFDRSSMWVYNIDSNRRYPLPETQPCGSNCRLSPDARWITYVDILTNSYGKMRLDGTQRTPLVDYAADVEWWSLDTLLVWTPGKAAYLRAEAGTDRQYLNVQGVVSVQPGGQWALLVEQDGDDFRRALVNLETRDLQGVTGGYIDLGLDKAYFDASSWSPDGRWLAYVAEAAYDASVSTAGGEIWGVEARGDATPVQWTNLSSVYGAVRINGRATGELSWSPDNRQIAFWVMEMLGPNLEANTGSARIHILNIETGVVRAYCGFTTTEHTPNPPRLKWSPDATHLALGGNVPGDERGYLLMALNLETGVFTELSEGIYPT